MKLPIANTSALILLAATAQPALAQERIFDLVSETNSVLAVSGNGSVSKEPDIAIFQVAVITAEPRAEEAMETNSAKMQSVLGAIRASGIPEGDVQTSGVTLEPVFRRRDRDTTDDLRPPEIRGYRAVNAIRITSRDHSDFGRVIDRLIRAGANSVEGPTFELADKSDELDEARIAAVKDAQRKADLYARAANSRVSRILFMDDETPRYSENLSDTLALFSASAAPPIAPGQITVSARVEIIFELVPM